MFKRKMIFAAVVGALGAGATGAYAQAPSGDDPALERGLSGNVELYGYLYPEFTMMSATSGTPAAVIPAGSTNLGNLSAAPVGLALQSRASVDASNSRFGFRGKEDLGGGMTAIWQLESTVPIDQGAGTLASRDSYVGLRGGFGTVRLGFMETVYKTIGDPMKFMNLGSGNFISASNILSARQPFNIGGAASSAGSFHLRQPNSLLYNSPDIGGFQASALYSPDETKVGTRNANMQSYGVTYKTGGLYLALAYEVHNDFFGGSSNLSFGGTGVANVSAAQLAAGTIGNNHSKDTSPRASVMYSWDKSRVSFDLTTIDFKESGQAAGRHFQDYKNTRYNVSWQQVWGSDARWRTMAQYTSAASGTCTFSDGSVCDTTGLNGNMLALGGEYWFSKRTALFALYAKLNNGSTASYNNTANAKTLSPGSDITQYALGVRTTF